MMIVGCYVKIDMGKDKINPDYYKSGGLEVIDILENKLSKEQYIGYLRGNIFKYLFRYQDKNKGEDLEKAKWYLERLIKVTTFI